MIKKIFCVLLFSCACVSCAWADVGINAENFPDDIFREYVRSKYDTDSDDILSEAEIARAKHIRVGLFITPLYGDISSLKGVEYFTALTSLECAFNKLTELDLSKNTALTYLDCYHNQLTALDVSRNVALTELICGYNQIAELGVSKNTALTALWCENNQLTELNVSKNTALDALHCHNNQLTALDVSKNTSLTSILCSYNQLTELDVSNNTALTALHCNNNQLTELDVSNNVSLEVLFCSNNQLIKLDLLGNIALHRTETDIQYVKGLKLTRRTDGTYYTDLMNDYGMTTTDLIRITSGSVQGYDRGRNKITTYNATSGIVNFSKYPSELYYNYDTGSGELLRVTMRAMPLITTEQPDDAYVGAEYSFKFKVGGAGSISWDIADSSKLPKGISFDISTGALEGTPQVAGEYKFSITASSSIGSDTKEFTLSVKAVLDNHDPLPKEQSNSGSGGGGCNSVPEMIVVIGVCVLHMLRINRKN